MFIGLISGSLYFLDWWFWDQEYQVQVCQEWNIGFINYSPSIREPDNNDQFSSTRTCNFQKFLKVHFFFGFEIRLPLYQGQYLFRHIEKYSLEISFTTIMEHFLLDEQYQIQLLVQDSFSVLMCFDVKGMILLIFLLMVLCFFISLIFFSLLADLMAYTIQDKIILVVYQFYKFKIVLKTGLDQISLRVKIDQLNFFTVHLAHSDYMYLVKKLITFRVVVLLKFLGLTYYFFFKFARSDYTFLEFFYLVYFSEKWQKQFSCAL